MQTALSLFCAARLLDVGIREIAKLTYRTANKENETALRYASLQNAVTFVPLVNIFYMQSTAVWEVALAVSLITTAAEFFVTQQHLAKLDQQRKAAVSKKQQQQERTAYIEHCGAGRSGWANDPKLLAKFPKFLSTRVLTCCTLVEVFGCLWICWNVPQYGALALAGLMTSHYITDALDGAIGRYRGEGYKLWGYYADHAFDAIYELACVGSIWLMQLNEDPSDAWGSIAGPLMLIAMASLMSGFHAKENVSFEKRLSEHYSNIIGGFPLHYFEFVAIGSAVVLHFAPVRWNSIGMVIASVLLLLHIDLVSWFYKHKVRV